MNTSDRLMLIIKALDSSAALAYSEYTHQWYVASHLSIGNGVTLTGVTEHRGSPDDAVRAYFDRLTSIGLDEYVAGSYRGHRREWRWNGAAFVETTRSEVLAAAQAVSA